MREAIEQVLEILNRPLSNQERDDGWTKKTKAGYAPVFAKLLAQVESGEASPYFGIARSLDAYGIGSGDLYEKMLRVANEVNDQLR